MFVILTYDINRNRVGKALKICRKYLVHVQKSVFEGQITESKLKRLKSELQKVIDVETDQIIVYSFESPKYATKEQIGSIIENTNIL